MPIDNTTPVIVPPVSAVPELEYPQLWLRSIQISAPSQTEGSINIESVPYSSLSGAFADSPEIVNIYTDDLWSAVENVSSVAVAMSAIFTASEDLRTYVESMSV